jgi:hypothetical protein
MSAKMYRIVLVCEAVPKNAGEAAAREITKEFTHRPWHVNATCTWDGSQLVLQADNDFDSDGLALRDEFSDALSAYIAGGFDGALKVLSVTEIDAG